MFMDMWGHSKVAGGCRESSLVHNHILDLRDAESGIWHDDACLETCILGPNL